MPENRIRDVSVQVETKENLAVNIKEEPEPEREKLNTSIVKRLDCLVTLWSFLGVLVPRRPRGSPHGPRDVLMKLYVVVINLCVWFDALRLVYCFNWRGEQFGSPFIHKLLLLIIMVQFAVLFTYPSLQSSKIVAFIDEWKRHLLNLPQHELLSHRKQLDRIFYLFVIVTAVAFALNIGVTVTLLKLELPELYPIAVPLYQPQMPTALQFMLLLYHVLCYMIMFCVSNILIFAFTMVSSTLRQCFGGVTEGVKRLKAERGRENERTDIIKSSNPRVDSPEDTKTTPESIEGLRLRHEDICRLVDISDEFFSFPIALSFTVGIAIVCFSMYGAAGDIDDSVVFITFFHMFYSIDMWVAILGGGIALNDKAHEAKRVLYSIDLRQMCEEQRSQFQVFLSRLNGSPIGFSALGMFTIDRSAALTMIGAVLTYAIIIFQFQMPTTGMCNLTANGTTSAPM